MELKRKAYTLFFVAFALFTNAFAQSEIKVLEYKVSSPIPVQEPVKIDSTDVNKKKFDDKNLLGLFVNFENALKQSQVKSADSAGIISLEKSIGGEKSFRVLSFNLEADRYSKVKIAVSSTEMQEVYVNNKREKVKETFEDSIKKARFSEIDLTMEPYKRYEIVIKSLVRSVDTINPAIKTTIKTDQKNSSSQLLVSVDGKRRININDIIEGHRITGSSLSPGGKYFLASYNLVFPGGRSSVYSELKELKTNRLITRFDGYSPRWMPSSDLLVYARNGVRERDLFTLDPATMQETCIAQGIKYGSFNISPDQSFMILSIQEEIPEDRGDLKRYLSPSDRAGSFRGRSSLYIYRFADQRAQQLTFGQTSAYLSDFRSDSKKILFMTSKEDLSAPRLRSSAVYEMDLQTLAIDTIAIDSNISSASYSPDYQKIIFTGSANAFEGIGLNIKPEQIANTYDTQSFIMDMKTREVSVISKDFNPSIASASWEEIDNRIYFSVDDEDRKPVYVYDPKSEKYERLDLQEDMISGFQIAKSAPVAIYRGESAANAYRLYSYDLKTKKSQLLSDPFAEQLSELNLSEMNDWNFKTADGTEIKGRYYLPVDFDPNKKYPMVVYYYAGTTPTTRIFESTYPLQTYSALGYVVYTLQPSGTIGFGQEFSARHVNAWGKVTADEIIEGTKRFCDEHSFVDRTKIGCIGASYGGFMTQYLQTQTDIFAAAISHAGISALSSYWGEGYWGYAYSAIASAGSFPWNNSELYVNQSPLFQADKINTPLLLLHGDVDTNVPMGESVQMFNALKLLGKTVEFVRVAGENHAIYGYQKRLDWNKTIHAWFAKWLKEQPEWWEALYPERAN